MRQLIAIWLQKNATSLEYEILNDLILVIITLWLNFHSIKNRGLNLFNVQQQQYQMRLGLVVSCLPSSL